MAGAASTSARAAATSPSSFAARSPCAHVVGLDIAGLSIERDTEIARERGLANLEFRSYDGLSLPFAEGAFDAGISRYALHHFPDLRLTLGELRRVITPEGVFVLSDPRTLDEDSSGFADEFQALRGDGHVHYYRRSEIEALFGEFGFAAELEFRSSVRYPRAMDPRYRRLLDCAAPRLLELYSVEIEGDLVYFRAEVMNILFRRRA